MIARLARIAAICAAIFATSVAQAGVILGGSSMLTSGYLSTLEGWLGEGQLTLTNIFTKNASDPTKDDSFDWHAAVDNRGRTFSIWEIVTPNGQGGQDQFIVGGYNPVSWNGALSNYVISATDAQRTAFIFNLTTSVKLSQCKSTDSSQCGYDDDSGNDVGQFQTYNQFTHGPSFGGGHDLHVQQNLSDGYNYGFSYGNPLGDVGWGSTSPLDNDNGSYEWTTVQALETFTIAPFAAVPEPASLALLGLGVLGFGFIRRRK